MLQMFAKSMLLLMLTVIICCGIYPAAIWAVGQTFFPFQANGSLLRDVDNKIVGSKLIAQAFTEDDYFHPRPSAASYDPIASASSTLAVSNPALRDRVARTIEAFAAHHDINLKSIPGDAVTTSASGLDPHITLQNAEFQLDRVSAKWAANLKRDPITVRNEIAQLLKKNACAPFYGLIGEKIVNVLEVNLALRQAYGKSLRN